MFSCDDHPPPSEEFPQYENYENRQRIAFVTHEIIFSLFVNDCELHLICTSSEFIFLYNAADGHRKLLGPCDILHLHKYLTETHFFTRKFLSKSDTPKQTYLKIICICFFMTTWWVFFHKPQNCFPQALLNCGCETFVFFCRVQIFLQ